MFDIVGKRYWYFLLSLIIIIPGTISLLTAHLRLGIDFTGGTEITFRLPQANQAVQLGNQIGTVVSGVSYVQPEITRTCPKDCRYLVRTKTLPRKQYLQVVKVVQSRWSGSAAIQQQTTSATIASQLTQQAVTALVVASVAILLYISFAFRNAPNPFRFGVAAIIAMLHDVLVVLGIFSILGALLRVEVDAPFVTAMLTIIGFSVHDTIVIFDRIRENVGRRTGEPFDAIVNHSILQSFVRSINTSFTVVLTLLAVFLFTGQSIRFFILAMLIGIISGTYSSIFNASQILVVWHNHEISKLLKGNRPQTALTKAAAL